MPVPSGNSQGKRTSPRPEQLALLEAQRRWVAEMVARGHGDTQQGWFHLKERALRAHQYKKAQAVARATDVQPVDISRNLSALLQHHKLTHWAGQLFEAGITTLQALQGIAGDHELPQGIPPPARRVLLGEAQRGSLLQQQQQLPQHFGTPAAPPPPPSLPSSASLSPPIHPRPASPAAASHTALGPSTDCDTDGAVANFDEKVIAAPQREDPHKIYEDIDLTEALPPHEASLVLVPCGLNGCKKKLAPERLKQHRAACQKSAKKREVFNTSEWRITSEAKAVLSDEAASSKDTGGAPKSNWRAESNNFRAACRGKPLPEAVDDRIMCPSCERKFNPQAAEGHIPSCAERMRRQQNRRANAARASGQGSQGGRIGHRS